MKIKITDGQGLTWIITVEEFLLDNAHMPLPVLAEITLVLATGGKAVIPGGDGNPLVAEVDESSVVVFSYTRAEAIADGVLIDVSIVAKELGFRYPVAITAGAWAEAVDWSDSNETTQDEAGRLWDVLWMLRVSANAPLKNNQLTFTVTRIPNEPKATEATELTLKAECGPGDSAEPVITIMLPNED